MSDIVERLRATLVPELYIEAADEIDRLRAEIERLKCDHIAAHRVSCMTIQHLERRLLNPGMP